MKQDFTIWRNQILQNPRDISPLKFGMSQDEIMEIFSKFGAVPMMRTRQYQKGFFNQPVTKNFRRKIFAINPGQVRPGFSIHLHSSAR